MFRVLGIYNFGALHFGTLKVTCLLCCVQNKEREAAYILRNYAFIKLQAYLLLMWIGYIRRGPLDSLQVNRDNRSDSLHLKLRCLFLFRT